MAKIEKIKRKIDRLKYGSIWGLFKKDLMLSPSTGIAVAVSLLLIGGYIAAIINYISNSQEALWRFILSFTISFLVLIVGFVFFMPFWKFRRRYYFLEEQEDNIALRLVNMHKRSNQALTTFDGINAVQFFIIETHTTDSDIVYRFKKVFSIKSRDFNLSKLKNDALKVPITFFDWLNNPNNPAPDYGEEINGLLYEWLERRSNDDAKFNNIIDEWNISFRHRPRIISLHYHVLFEPRESVDANTYKPVDEIDPIFLMEYNGINKEHMNRQYYSIRIYIKDEKEGILEGILLIIGNKRRIDTNKIRQIVSGILNNKGDENAYGK